jgi:hypothetical protein
MGDLRRTANMRSGLAQAQERAVMRPLQEPTVPSDYAPTIKEIPYDYVARFTLQGKRGNRVQDVINISVEGAFVAVAIAYSFVPARVNLAVQLPRGLARFFPANPDAQAIFQCLQVRLCGIDFKYNIIDSGTGRELQNQPIHNIAGLGKSDGDRPFRPLAKPIIFAPRSTIRVEIEEISEGQIYGYDDPKTNQRIGAELFFVLHGYKMLG